MVYHMVYTWFRPVWDCFWSVWVPHAFSNIADTFMRALEVLFHPELYFLAYKKGIDGMSW